MPVYRVPAELTWSGPGSPGVNVWSLRTTDTETDAVIDAALGELVTFYTSLQLYLAPGTRVTIGPGIAERTTQEDRSRPSAIVEQTGTESDLPAATQIVVGWRTSLRARRGMGRTFIGPLRSSAAQANGAPSTNLRTAVLDAASALIAAGGDTNGWAFGVWGLEQEWDWEVGPPPDDVPRVHRDFVSASVKDKFAVLRSRRD
jgi:hypothetical protein